MEIKSKYFTTTDYNKFTNEKFDVKMKQKQLIYKSDTSEFLDNSDLNKKIATLETKAELKLEQDKIIKPQAFYSSYFCGKSYFEDDGTQNYLVFQPMCIFLKKLVALIIFQNRNLKDRLMKA